MKKSNPFTFLVNALTFLRKNFIYDPYYSSIYVLKYFDSDYYVKPKIFSEEEFISKIKDGTSFIRFGDGEIFFLRNQGIFYQKPDKLLSRIMRTIVSEYSSESKYIIGLPHQISQSNFELRESSTFHYWYPFKVNFELLFNKNANYSDSFLFIQGDFFEKSLLPIIRKKTCIILTTRKDIQLQKDSMEKHLNCIWVEAKAPDPFDWYEKNISEIEEIIRKNDLSSKNSILLLAAGPSSKALAYYFSGNGFQAIDVGSGFSSFFKR